MFSGNSWCGHVVDRHYLDLVLIGKNTLARNMFAYIDKTKPRNCLCTRLKIAHGTLKLYAVI